MAQLLTDVLSVVTGSLVVLSVAGCLSIFAVHMWHWLPAVGLWRLKRTTIVVLSALAVIATIEAQKRTGGDGTSGSPSSQTEPDGGDAEPPPLRDAPTNTLHFAAISTGTNAVSLTLAWPPDLFASGTVLDLFAATSLVETVWDWQCAHTVANGETNWIATVGHDGSARFFLATERADPGDMRDTDGDGIPDVYELHNGTNPYVPDYAAAPKLTVGPSGAFGTIEAAVEASAAYSIVELDPSVSHEVGGQSLGCRIPQHPIMVTASRPYAVIRSAGWSAFLLDTNTTSRTVFRNLYLLLDARNSFQAGFWCGGNLPWCGVPASATFQNIYVRMPNPGVRYRAWNFHRSCDDVASILNCMVNAAGADEAVAIYATGSPPLLIDGCSFVNFPPNNGPSTVAGVILQTGDCSDGGSSVTVSRTVFDETFTNALPFCRFDSAKPYALAVSDCIVPSPLVDRYAPDEISGITVTNAALSWSGVPRPDSSSVALGIGSLAPVDNDPSADADGDGLSDYAEAYEHGTDPFLADSDNDGVPDATEIGDGTDPTNPNSFMQTLTMTATNTVSPSHPVLVAWGFSEAGWETNGLTNFPSGSGTVTYTNASIQSATHIKAFCDLNENGEYDADWDILLVREIPHGSTAQISFAFGDVDGDGVSDIQERTDGTDPYDAENYRVAKTVTFESSDVAPGLTNYVAWGLSANGWETNGWTSFSGGSIAFPIDVTVTGGEVFLKVFRDFNANGVYDAGTDALVTKRLTKADNGRPVTVTVGDSDGDGVTDTQEFADGTDPCDAKNFRFSVTAKVTNDDNVSTITNYLACGLTPTGWETNGLVSFEYIKSKTFYKQFQALTTNGMIYVKCYRDFNRNGVYDSDEDALYVQQIGASYNRREYAFTIGDRDLDKVLDSVELEDGTDPLDGRSYCFNMTSKVRDIFQTTNRLTVTAMFGTNLIYGPLVVTGGTWTANLGHLSTTNKETVHLDFWDDANGNGVLDEGETATHIHPAITGHVTTDYALLPYGAFDADGNGLLDAWEIQTGLNDVPNCGAHVDTDGDGLTDFLEYIAGTDPLVPDGSNTLLSVMSRSVDDRLIGKSANESVDMFVNYPENGYSHIFDPNTNCWTYGVDLTCCSMWNDGPTISACGPTQTAVTAISPRHVIYAAHYDYLENNHVFQHITTNALQTMPADKIYYFRGRSGQVYGRHIVNRKSVGGDISIGLLNEALPTNDVLPACVMPTNFVDYIYDGRYLPVLTVDQQERAIVRSCAGFNILQVREFVVSNLPIGNRQTFNKPVFIGGDSSSPRFVLVDNVPVLLGVLHTAGGSGSFVSQYLTKIATAMDSLQPSSEYQLNILDLSGYTTISPSE